MAGHSFTGLEGKTALITGASTGIGKGVALRLASLGVNLGLFSRTKATLEKTAEEIRNLAPQIKVTVLSGDAGKEADIKQAVEKLIEPLGSFDFLVHCAGQAKLGSASQMNTATVRELVEANTLGTYWVCQQAALHLKEQGAIVLINSPAGVYGAAGASAYALSKGGMTPLARSLARELASRKIRVNVVVPGYIETPLTKTLYSKLTPAQVDTHVIKKHPLGPGDVDDVAWCAAFLLSDQAKWITGAEIPVDGGYTAGLA